MIWRPTEMLRYQFQRINPKGIFLLFVSTLNQLSRCTYNKVCKLKKGVVMHVCERDGIQEAKV